jgi:hypothetical protein
MAQVIKREDGEWKKEQKDNIVTKCDRRIRGECPMCGEYKVLVMGIGIGVTTYNCVDCLAKEWQETDR